MWNGTAKKVSILFELRRLLLGSGKDGDAGVGVLPSREEVLIRRPALVKVALPREGATEAELGEWSVRVEWDGAESVDEFFEFCRCLRRPIAREISRRSQVHDEEKVGLVRSRRFQFSNGRSRASLREIKRGAYGWNVNSRRQRVGRRIG